MSADRGSDARFTLSLLRARLDQYSIKIGDTISPDHPAKGAGVITELGQKQSYSFAGRVGEVLWFQLGPCEGAMPSFDLLAPNGNKLDFAGCHPGVSRQDLGRQILPTTGQYRIVAGTDKSNVSSRYSFYVHEVPGDEHFSARLPLNVSPGAPSRTAGHIAAQGAQQFFDFTPVPAQLSTSRARVCARIWRSGSSRLVTRVGLLTGIW